VARRSSDAGSGTDDVELLTSLKALLPKSARLLPALYALQLFEMVLPCNVTAEVSAMARPQRISAPVFRLMLSSARMFPAKSVVVPRVAELPTSQYMELFASPPTTSMAEALAVVSVLAIWNTKDPLGSLAKLRVSAPVNCADDEKE